MVPQIENNSRIGRLAIKYCILSLSEVTKYVVNRHLVSDHIRYVVHPKRIVENPFSDDQFNLQLL